MYPWELDLRILNTSPNVIGERPGTESSLEAGRKAKARNLRGSLRGLQQKTFWQIRSIHHWYFG